MRMISVSTQLIPREKLANPFERGTLRQRLIDKGSIDLRDNLIVEELGGGYSRNIPIDPNKRIEGWPCG